MLFIYLQVKKYNKKNILHLSSFIQVEQLAEHMREHRLAEALAPVHHLAAKLEITVDSVPKLMPVASVNRCPSLTSSHHQSEPLTAVRTTAPTIHNLQEMLALSVLLLLPLLPQPLAVTYTNIMFKRSRNIHIRLVNITLDIIVRFIYFFY